MRRDTQRLVHVAQPESPKSAFRGALGKVLPPLTPSWAPALVQQKLCEAQDGEKSMSPCWREAGELCWKVDPSGSG